jgi:hypothetical protein
MAVAEAKQKAAGPRRELTFSVLHRLLRHLRRGGTRKGACGWAGIAYAALERGRQAEPRLDECLERAEMYGLARDERFLDSKVCKGDRQALLFRMRMVYGYAQGRGGEEAGKTTDEPGSEFREIERRIGALGPPGRRRLAAAHREAAVR